MTGAARVHSSSGIALRGAYGLGAGSESGGRKRKGLNAAEAAYLISKGLVRGFGTTEELGEKVILLSLKVAGAEAPGLKKTHFWPD